MLNRRGDKYLGKEKLGQGTNHYKQCGFKADSHGADQIVLKTIEIEDVRAGT